MRKKIVNTVKNTALLLAKSGVFLFFIPFYTQATTFDTLSLKADSEKNIYIIYDHSISNAIKRTKKTANRDNYYRLLDSLGCFLSKISDNDTLLTIYSGERFSVDTISIIEKIKSNSPSFVDLPKQNFLYDSHIIDIIAKKIVTHYTKYGYPFIEISVSISRNDSIHELEILFNIDTKEEAVFGTPLYIVDGKLKHKVIAHDILFKESNLYDDTKVSASISRLNNRSYIDLAYSDAPVLKMDNSFITNKIDSLSNEQVIIPIHIKELSGMGIDGIIGYNSSDESKWNGLANITLQNALHRGEALTLHYRGENKLQEFSFNLSKAYPFNLPILFDGNFGLEIEEDDYGYIHGDAEFRTALKGRWEIGAMIKAHETSFEKTSRFFYGINLILELPVPRYYSGKKDAALKLVTGSGVVDNNGVKNGRFEFGLTAEGHLPTFKKQALLTRISTGAITTSDSDSLHISEMLRVGGYKSIRGYSNNEYAFNAMAFLQAEYLYYFNKSGAIYLLADGGGGVSGDLNIKNLTTLFGYGAGIRVPLRAGVLSLEWARNYKEKRGAGRIHLRLQNRLSKK